MKSTPTLATLALTLATVCLAQQAAPTPPPPGPPPMPPPPSAPPPHRVLPPIPAAPPPVGPPSAPGQIPGAAPAAPAAPIAHQAGQPAGPQQPPPPPMQPLVLSNPSEQKLLDNLTHEESDLQKQINDFVSRGNAQLKSWEDQMLTYQKVAQDNWGAEVQYNRQTGEFEKPVAAAAGAGKPAAAAAKPVEKKEDKK